MITIELAFEEGSQTERCIRALCALYPGLEPEAILESMVEYDFSEALNREIDLLESYAGMAGEYMEAKAKKERALRKQFDIERKGRSKKLSVVAVAQAA